MAHELTHAEAGDLLGVYALDALDGDEREAVDRHLAGCDLCRVEVQEHLEVAGLLSSGLAPAPAAVWDHITAELHGTPPPLDMAPIHALRPDRDPDAPDRAPDATDQTEAGRPTAVPGPAARQATPSGPFNAPGANSRPSADRRAPRRGSGVRIGALVAAATVAASVIGVLGIRIVDDGRRIDAITAGVHGVELERTVNAAMADPKAVKVELRSSDGLLFADAWMLPGGRGYLARNNLPNLTADRNYQLWAVVGDKKISVGLMGSEPKVTAFMADGPVRALAITEEIAGGVVASQQQPLVVGELQTS